jgi:flagellar biogenesis protein FliO
VSLRLFRRGVIGLALAATSLTATAFAETEPTVAPASSAPSGTPLGVRPTKSLELAPDGSSSAFGWKLGLLVLGGAFGIWAWRRRGPTNQATDLPELRILRRTTVGVRSELIVVEMDGQRLLLGVTPNAIQNLYIAPLSDSEEEDVVLDRLPALPAAAPPAPVEIVRRPAPEKKPASRRLRVAGGEAIEEQARGIYAGSEQK